MKFGQAEVDLFVLQETTHCLLCFSLTHPTSLGLDAMVQTWLRLHLLPPPDSAAPRSSGKSTPGRGLSSTCSCVLASMSMVL